MSPVVILMQKPYYAEVFSFPNLKIFYFVDVKWLKEGGGYRKRQSTFGSARSECVTFNSSPVWALVSLRTK